jgi:hypothetical protein
MVAIASNFDEDEIFASTIGGLVLAAPKGTAAPTTPTADWATGWVSVGLISDDGVTTTLDTDVEDKNAWNARGTVKRIPKSAGLSFQFTAMQSNDLTYELFFGAAPATITGGTRTAIPATSPVKEWAFAVQYPGLDGTTLKRYIMPVGTVTDRGDLQQSETDLEQFEITVSALVTSGTTDLGYILTNAAGIVGV